MSKKLGFIFLVVAAMFVMTTVASAAGSKTNVNGTGTGTLTKALSGHTVHGNYKNNTNSCASCHQTHTASSSANLLFKSDASETCEACHEGQLGIYNVEDNKDEGAGSFEHASMGSSIHNVDGTRLVSAAPGARADMVLDTDTTSHWTTKFECTSCHNPHGSYSDRLLSVNPYQTTSEKAKTNRQYWNASTATGNVWDTTVKVNPTAAATDLVKIPVVGTYATPVAFDNVTGIATGLPTGKVNSNGADIAFAVISIAAGDVASGKYYYNSGLVGGEKIVQAYRFVGGAWTPVPIMSGASKTANVWVDSKQVTQGGDATTAATTLFNPVKGFWVQGSAFTAVTKAAFPMIVKLALVSTGTTPVNGVQETMTDLAAQYTGANKNNIAYSEWCGACHTDYFATSKVATGVDSDMNHHTVSSEKNGRSCNYCHFAHGTNVNLMKDALGKTVANYVAGGMSQASAEAYMMDVNPSSALKRFTNMTVCYGCHTSSHYGSMGNNGTTGYGSATGLGAGITGNTAW